MLSRTLRRLLTIVLACLLGASPRAYAQPGAPGAPGAPPSPATPGEIEIALETFGVGGVARPGEWAGVRLVLTDRADRPRAVAVRVHLPDPDGDTALLQRVVTLNPGLAQGVWLYLSLPWEVGTNTVFTVTVHEFDVNAASDDPGAGVGEQVAAGRITPRSILEPSRPGLGVLGQSPAGGLVGYETPGPQGQGYPSTSHELPAVVLGLTPAALPDRWMGLAPLETLVWITGEPGSLSESQAQAVREWVHRGGHLVISLPAAGQSWTNPRANPLHALLPAVDVDRVEGVDLRTHAPLLQPRGGTALPSATVHVLRPVEDASLGEADVVLASPSGEPVVVRRALGAGLVTLVGYDLADTRLGARLDTQYFWHRVLGKRFDVVAREEVRALDQSGRASFRFFDPARLDGDIGREVAKQGRAGAGVMLGLAVFALYLVIAGPGGYALLRMRGATRHAWVAFVGCIGMFAALAWGGAAALRPVKAEVQHLTFFDHVFGQPEQHARLWFSALLPTYGDARVTLGTDDDRAAWNQTLSAWADPAAITGKPFPDTRGYVVDTRDPASYVVPARSTVKQFRGDWLGRTDFGVPIPVGGPLSIVDEGGTSRLTGALRHSLPQPLEDVTIVLVRGQKPLRGDLGALGSGVLFGRVSAARLVQDWAPGEPLALDQIPPSAWDTGEAYFERLTDTLSRGSGGFGTALPTSASGSMQTKLEAMGWHAALRPPRFLSTGGGQERIIQRSETHGLDLSAWLTRPCVVIIGHMTDAETPAPVFIDGRRVPSRGRVVVRWVYPLASEPPQIPATSSSPEGQ